MPFDNQITILTIFFRPSSTIGIVRTVKAERRLRDRLREEGLLTDEDDTPLSPAEERALRAEKRAAWRAARLKSLEQDAIQAQMVIKSMTDMVGVGELPTITSPVPPATSPEPPNEIDGSPQKNEVCFDEGSAFLLHKLRNFLLIYYIFIKKNFFLF